MKQGAYGAHYYYIVDVLYPVKCANILLCIEKVLLNLLMSSKMNNSAIEICLFLKVLS